MAPSALSFIPCVCLILGGSLATTLPWLRPDPPSCPERSPDGCHCRQMEHRPMMICTGLESFPDFGPESYGIYTLDVSHNSLQEDTVIIPAFSHLRQLVLNHNQIGGMDRWQLEPVADTLHHLALSHNSLSDIPSIISSLPHLQVLDLSYNNIRTLRWNSFTRNQNLRRLYLDRNPVIEVESSVVLPSLQVLYVSPPRGSAVTAIPEFPSLHTLALIGSPMVFTDSESWFSVLSELRHLSYVSEANHQSASIQNMPSGVLGPRLTHLSLANNSLIANHELFEWLRYFTQLEGLDLSFNSLDSVDLEVLQGMSSLSDLNLEGNGNMQVDRELLTDLPTLRLLNLRNVGLRTLNMRGYVGRISPHLLVQLAHNPWRCTCRLSWLHLLMERQLAGESSHLEQHEILDGIRCELPSNLRGILVKDAPIGEESC